MTSPFTSVQPADIGDDFDVIHTPCCDEDVAICGEDLTGEPWVEDDEGIPCPLCETALADDALCPVRGCRLRRLLRIGPWRRGGA